MTIRAGIIGGTGYTARELMRILLRHPQVEITYVSSRQTDYAQVADAHPMFAGQVDLPFRTLDVDDLGQQADFVFGCLPHGASARLLAPLIAREVPIIDLSADYRLNSPDVYARYYGQPHPDPRRLGHVPYGLPELFAEEIATAKMVANPGCFPTSTILALAPLIMHQRIQPDGIIVDSKTGVSGAGRTPQLKFHFPECNESVVAYGVGNHRHLPEIQQVLARLAGQPASCLFTPHLVPMDRGILTTIYAQLQRPASEAELFQLAAEFYGAHPFVRVVPEPPAVKQVAHTNFCDLSLHVLGGRLVVFAALDNLIKGAAGNAVQCFNLMNGLDERTALLDNLDARPVGC